MPAFASVISRPESQSMGGAQGKSHDLAELLEALPCLAFIEHGGLVLARNRLATAQTGVATDPTPVGLVFLGAHPFAAPGPRPQPHLLESSSPPTFDCMLHRGNRRPLAIHGVCGPLEKDQSSPRLIIALEGPRHNPAAGEGTFLGELLEAAPEAMAITQNGRLHRVNREFSRLFGYAPELCVGKEIDALLMPTGSNRDMETILHLIAANGSASLETVRHTQNGNAIDVSILVGPVPVGPEGYGLFYTFRDIRPQKEAEARLRYTAMHDALTDLPNRTFFLERLRAALTRLRRSPERAFSVIFLDLDGFKAANDVLGHRAGDALLCEIANRLRECLRPEDTVARLGGDEFALLIDQVVSAEDIDAIATRIQVAIRRPVEMEAGEAGVSASMGVTLIGDTSCCAEELLHHADTAMYHAKANGKGRHEIFNCDMSLPKLLQRAS